METRKSNPFNQSETGKMYETDSGNPIVGEDLGDWKVERRSLPVSTLAAFRKKIGLVSVYCGHFRTSKGHLKIKGDFKTMFF